MWSALSFLFSPPLSLLCSLADQKEAVAAKGVPPFVPADFQPVLKKSVCYIVAAVLFNEKGEVNIVSQLDVKQILSCKSGWAFPKFSESAKRTEKEILHCFQYLIYVLFTIATRKMLLLEVLAEKKQIFLFLLDTSMAVFIFLDVFFRNVKRLLAFFTF
jgi:hypothetical protein